MQKLIIPGAVLLALGLGAAISDRPPATVYADGCDREFRDQGADMVQRCRALQAAQTFTEMQREKFANAAQ